MHESTMADFTVHLPSASLLKFQLFFLRTQWQSSITTLTKDTNSQAEHEQGLLF